MDANFELDVLREVARKLEVENVRLRAEVVALGEVATAASVVAKDIGERGAELIRDGATLYIDPPTEALFVALAKLDAVRGGG